MRKSISIKKLNNILQAKHDDTLYSLVLTKLFVGEEADKQKKYLQTRIDTIQEIQRVVPYIL